MADTSQYKVGIVLSIENKSGSGKKPLKACSVNVGGDEPITVVTSASNVREGSRIVIAPIGSTIINDEGEEQTLKKTNVGGIPSEGMFCDSRMLGWGSGSAGIAAQVPDSYEPGMAPPTSKPGAPQKSSEEAVPATEVKGLFEKKLTKEEKKKLAEEKRKARKAAKEAKKKEEGS
eukprot:CAMPEP_0183713154 /NCGR_PEP_ID=MMETSP0737-20130205/8096_1 /TAXON_ID=385413 /ORGANISM="Thalassiosira miniscula, Strain CCMP1093" /LENGTH=174 /DNA_ID=CAMNT_0025941903 /DNA_START=56 /DNA_END=580 /DNA_ORIENTATION=-